MDSYISSCINKCAQEVAISIGFVPCMVNLAVLKSHFVFRIFKKMKNKINNHEAVTLLAYLQIDQLNQGLHRVQISFHLVRQTFYISIVFGGWNPNQLNFATDRHEMTNGK